MIILPTPFCAPPSSVKFEIIGEALNRALRLDPSLGDQISDTRRIISFRNVLIHGYASISDEVVWGVVEVNLPKLRQEVDRLLSESESAPAG